MSAAVPHNLLLESDGDILFLNDSPDKGAIIDKFAARRPRSTRSPVISSYFRREKASLVLGAVPVSSATSPPAADVASLDTPSKSRHASRLAAFKYTSCAPLGHSTPITVHLSSLLLSFSPLNVIEYSPTTRTRSSKTKVSPPLKALSSSGACSANTTSVSLETLDAGFSASDPASHKPALVEGPPMSRNVSFREISQSVKDTPFISRLSKAYKHGEPHMLVGAESFESFAPNNLASFASIDSIPSSQGDSVILASSPSNLLSTLCLPSSIRDFFSFTHFNSMQSHAYPTIFNSSLSVVVSAPTGSGKTVLFELAILKELVESGKSVRAVLICPTRTLCSQIYAHWNRCFQAVGLSVGLLTSETSQTSIIQAKNSNIVIATPEKLDAITRSFKTAFAELDLLSIDEIHTVGSGRGALVEVLVLRIKCRSPNARIIASSATIENSQDIAQWLGFGQKAKVMVFGSEYQSVHVENVVWPCGKNTSPFKFENTLNSHIVQVVETHYAKKLTLVFCSTRKNCVTTAIYLLNNAPRLFPRAAAADSVTDPALANLMAHGLAFHHAGMSTSDRTRVETAFLRGQVLVICCTSTLAVGVNLPAFLVVIKGTMCWKNGTNTEYTHDEILQMSGRAGRPQFECAGKSVIMTSTKDAARFASPDLPTRVLESFLESSLPEQLVAEIYLGAIKNLCDAVKWFSSTFMYTRVLADPLQYRHLNTLESGPTSWVRRYLATHLAKLAADSLVSLHSDPYTCTDFGTIMVRHTIQYETMINMLRLKAPLSIHDLVLSLSHAVELGFVFVKQAEQAFLARTAKMTSLKVTGKFSPVDKACLYLYCELERIDILKHGEKNTKAASDFVAEMPSVVKQYHRLVKALLETFVKTKDLLCSLQCLTLWRSLNSKCWENTAGELMQVPEITSEIKTTLAIMNAFTINDVCDMLDALLRQAARDAFHAIRRRLDSFPRFNVCLTSEGDSSLALDKTKLIISIKTMNLFVPRFWNNSPIVFTVVTCESSRLLDYRKISATLLDENGCIEVFISANPRNGMLQCKVAIDNICSAPVVARWGVKISLRGCFSDDSINDSLGASQSSELASIEQHLNVSGVPTNSSIDLPSFRTHLQANSLQTQVSRPALSQQSQCVDCVHPCRNKLKCGHICCKYGTLEMFKRPVDCTTDRSLSRNSVYTPTPSFSKRAKVSNGCGGFTRQASISRPLTGVQRIDPRSILPCTPLNTVPPDMSAGASTVSSIWKLVDIDTLRKDSRRFSGQALRFGQQEEDDPIDTSPSTSLGADYNPYK